MVSTSLLLNLVDELKLVVVDNLIQDKGPPKDILKLSATCRNLRNLLKPLLFKRVYLKNNNTSAKSIQELLKRDDKASVKELYYIGSSPDQWSGATDLTDDESDGIDDDSSVDKYLNLATILPARTRDILQHLDRFPNLDRVIVDFREDPSFDEPFWGIFEDIAMTMDAVGSMEAKLAGRALMAKTFDAIAENWSTKCIKSFEIRNQPAMLVTSWSKPNFRKLLNTLTEFRISTFEMENNQSEAPCTNMFDEWEVFVPALGRYFLRQLHSVETLSFGGSCKGAIGGKGELHARNPMKAEYMPKLRELHLHFDILDEALIKFITGHAGRLETLHMEDCYAEKGHSARDRHTWAEFFGAIESSGPKKLRILKVEWSFPVEVASSLENEDDDSPEESEDGSETENREMEAVALAQRQGERKIFAYCEIEEDMGTLLDDEKTNLEALQKGQDFEAYISLKKIVDANAAAYAGGRGCVGET